MTRQGSGPRTREEIEIMMTTEKMARRVLAGAYGRCPFRIDGSTAGALDAGGVVDIMSLGTVRIAGMPISIEMFDRHASHPRRVRSARRRPVGSGKLSRKATTILRPSRFA